MVTVTSLAGLLTLVVGAVAAPLNKRQAPSGVPDYVLTYAPIVHLHSKDSYRPSDIGSQLTLTQPEVNFTVISGAPDPLTLDNLNDLNDLGGDSVYLTSKDNIQDNPSWLYGVTPDSSGKTEDAVSCAIIVNDHGSGLVDAFYMYLYAFDYGGKYLGHVIGDHVGDWEHNMVRFQDGKPQAVWYSQHANGEAFTYDVVHKYTDGLRPISYSAIGSHANYAIMGAHGAQDDLTDRGPIWDPTLSAYFYNYNASSSTFAAYDDSTPVNWLYFTGHWGDKKYPSSDPRQKTVFGVSGSQKYTNGPTGPEAKHLNRTEVCLHDKDACDVRTVLG